jgi:hypothetical protein
MRTRPALVIAPFGVLTGGRGEEDVKQLQRRVEHEEGPGVVVREDHCQMLPWAAASRTRAWPSDPCPYYPPPGSILESYEARVCIVGSVYASHPAELS